MMKTDRASIMQNSWRSTRLQSPCASETAAVDSRLTIYFHGVPGGSSELAAFEESARTFGQTILCFNRFELDGALSGSAYFAALADAVRAVAGERKINLIGFSIGACVALHISYLLGAQVGQLHLVSAAAPLQLGHFLPSMAGEAVFQTATATPRLFKAMALCQAALARWAPGMLRSMLFRSAAGADRMLASTPEFRLSMNELLHTGLHLGRAGYVRDILAYVQDWSTIPAQITVETTLWHGSLDNWSPLEMAICLNRVIPNCKHLNVLEGLSHYSCLQSAAPHICRELAA